MRDMTNTTHHTTAATAIYMQEDSTIDETGDEVTCWAIFAGDDCAEPVGTVVTAYSEGIAWEIAENTARTFGLQIVGPRD